MTLTQTVAHYKKATGAFIGTLVGLGTSVLALNVLSGNTAHDVAIACAIGTALLGPLGAALAPPNGPKTTVLVENVKKLLGDADAVRAVARAALHEEVGAIEAAAMKIPTAGAPAPTPGGTP